MMSEPKQPDEIDTEGRTLPPYEGRKKSANVSSDKAQSVKSGVKTAGAAGPVEDDDMKAPDPRDTPGGATSSPAHERSVSRSSKADDDGTGPAHQRGTPRAEDQP
ncbi:hypothetical protein [Streptomyces sp. RKAG337]|uniref:hypothetical protein n=1 Tax=Streptomyces sp. RKAG337 TaxID=2893404 RepID=UPI00203424B7|nr:hypothetical protein [Streptomyces sp. RKAG337]MCM2425117.1 hypothetical protein [Streptomyces sp. RKAG337]